MKKNFTILIKILVFCLFLFILKKYKNVFNNHNNSNKRVIKDVLYISGLNPDIVPYYSMFHIYNQIEQLNAGNLDSVILYYLNIEPIIVRDFRIIIFYRCPWTEKVGEAINLAKSLKKKILFDIDDLVFDQKYTDLIPYVQTLSESEKIIYVNKFTLIGKTLHFCEGAITTTEFLCKELKNYINSVFINPYVVSEKMFNLSHLALEEKSKIKNSSEIIIGYFSSDITSNSDIEMIIPVLINILREFKNVKLFLMGEFELPYDLKEFSSKIIKKPIFTWEKLPEIISSVDINIVPINENIFNEAKSENKWVEAALVKVPTVASNFGVYKQIIDHGETGLLCTSNEDWYKELKIIITNEKLRKTIAENAFEVCKQKYNTLETSNRLVNHINSVANKHIGFIIPSLMITGGIRVVLVHASFLQDEGWDVDLLAPEVNSDFIEFQEHKFNLISLNNAIIESQYDILVATFFATLFTVLNYSKVKRRLYLVQSYETDFYHYGNYLRGVAEKTYFMSFGVEYITISKWCETWLKEKYLKNPRFAPNGIDLNYFKEHKRQLNKEKIRILIEGDNLSHYKNVDESFKIIEKLDRNKYEIWYMSYRAEPKVWYKVDKFLNKVPYEKVGQIYEKCDILIKSSWIESFSYPPLEMMATGGYCIVVPNNGNVEYLKDGENCLFYKQGDIDEAVQCIQRLVSDENLQQKLYKNGLETAKKRDLKYYKKQILALYEEKNYNN